ncbi:MAG: alpha/beta fold hydrolase [Stackebrandtia sp.]
MPERRDLTTPDLTLSYLVDGPADATPVILIHGGSRDATNWAAVTDGLAKRHRVYSIDMRGHGKTSWTSEYSFDLVADDVSVLVAAEQLSGVILIGHSLGGGVASFVAKRRPDWLSKLVLEEPSVIPPDVPKQEKPRRPEAEPGFDWETLMDWMVAATAEPKPEWWFGLRNIAVPTLMYIGRDAQAPQHQRMRAASELIPDCRVELIPVGHDVHLDAHDDFMRVLDAFVAGQALRSMDS